MTTPIDTNQSPDHTSAISYGSYSSGMNAIAMINEIMVQMQDLLEELRNMMQEYSQSQSDLGWEIQMAGIKEKKAGIEDAFDAAVKGAWATIGSGGLAVIGSTIGGIGGASSNSITQHISKSTSTLLQAGGQVTEGGLKLDLAEDTKNADKKRADGDLIMSGAQQYAKNISELRDLIQQVRQQLQSLTKDLVEVKAKMDNSVNIR
ncbi:hypothetical protein [uncultured Shewanella sp.]|uniref:hypothetical protein n=1 Tax=uncultured Shewanella sp. TaxID=173975 RepID=UPI0026243D1F|nr:hypothetical protein [uncultured Shewanella sp.]